jgi:poly(beta-D-mannuronate) lyase
MFTLRHGNGCLVEGNFFIGNHKRGSGDIRIIGENHAIINNYIEGVENGGFWLTAGMTEPATVRARLLDECRTVRSALATHLERLPDELDAREDGSGEDGGVDPEAAEATDSGSVGGRQPRAPSGKRGAGPVAKRKNAVGD